MSGRRSTWKLRGLDPGIREAVWALRREGIETVQSCQGGAGHSFPEPTVRFDGERGEGFRALEIVLRSHVLDQIGIPPRSLRRTWHLIDGEPVGPVWELTWWPLEPCRFRTGPSGYPSRALHASLRSSDPHRSQVGCGRRASPPPSRCDTCHPTDALEHPSSPSCDPSQGDA